MVAIINAGFPGDAHFTELDRKLCKEASRMSHAPDEKNLYSCHFVVYDRKT